MRYLITGGAGFIGSHLATRLIDRGDEVLVLDDLSTGSMDNIAALVDRPGFSYRIGSALDVPLVSECVDRCDVTIHLAAAVGVRLIVERPVHTIETNVKASEVVLAAAATWWIIRRREAQAARELSPSPREADGGDARGTPR